MVKPFVLRNKNDAADARAIWTAVQQPGIKAVAVKSEGQQAVRMSRLDSRLAPRPEEPLQPPMAKEQEYRKFKRTFFSQRTPGNALEHPLMRSLGSAAAC